MSAASSLDSSSCQYWAAEKLQQHRIANKFAGQRFGFGHLPRRFLSYRLTVAAGQQTLIVEVPICRSSARVPQFCAHASFMYTPAQPGLPPPAGSGSASSSIRDAVRHKLGRPDRRAACSGDWMHRTLCQTPREPLRQRRQKPRPKAAREAPPCSNSTMCRPTVQQVRTCTTSTARSACCRLSRMTERN